VEDDISIDSEILLVIDFVNLKMTQSFRNAHRGMMYVRLFIKLSVHTYINIYIYIVLLKKLSHSCKFNKKNQLISPRLQ
jgi:hypothetical protein